MVPSMPSWYLILPFLRLMKIDHYLWFHVLKGIVGGDEPSCCGIWESKEEAANWGESGNYQ